VAFSGAYKPMADDVFLKLLRRHYSHEVWVSFSRNAANFALKIFAKAPDADGYKAGDFKGAMARLIADGRIKMESYGRKAARQRLAVVEDSE
jgi:hypothetical protein